jgi:hypothetical protein
MSLPWVRIDSNIASHDKVLQLLSDPSPKRWQAAFSYVCAIGWSGDQGTDGRVPAIALPFVHGTTTTARLLVTYRLWEEPPTGGWLIVNYAERQELAVVSHLKRERDRINGRRAACMRWHGPDCWKGDRCSQEDVG